MKGFRLVIASVLLAVGLTHADARLGLWAMLEGMVIPGDPSDDDVKQLRDACRDDVCPLVFASQDLPSPAAAVAPKAAKAKKAKG